MLTLFWICAALGGTILVCQFLLTVIGLGGDFDTGDDLPDPGDLEDVSAATHGGQHGSDPGDGHSSSLFFGMLTFRTITAALAFFGLSGLAADAAGCTLGQTLFIAVAAGFAAMVSVHRLMELFTQLKSDGTVRLTDALNREGTVYLRIPAGRGGRGKIHVVLKDQTVELQAETNHDAIPSGAVVRVTQFVGADVVSVERVDVVRPLSATATTDA